MEGRGKVVGGVKAKCWLPIHGRPIPHATCPVSRTNSPLFISGLLRWQAFQGSTLEGLPPPLPLPTCQIHPGLMQTGFPYLGHMEALVRSAIYQYRKGKMSELICKGLSPSRLLDVLIRRRQFILTILLCTVQEVCAFHCPSYKVRALPFDREPPWLSPLLDF